MKRGLRKGGREAGRGGGGNVGARWNGDGGTLCCDANVLSRLSAEDINTKHQERQKQIEREREENSDRMEMRRRERRGENRLSLIHI